MSTSAIDCLGRFVSEMTCYVSSGTLNLTKPKPSTQHSAEVRLNVRHSFGEPSASAECHNLTFCPSLNLSTLEVSSRRGAIQIHVYLTVPYLTLSKYVRCASDSSVCWWR